MDRQMNGHIDTQMDKAIPMSPSNTAAKGQLLPHIPETNELKQISA